MARPASNEYLKLRGKTYYVRFSYTPAMREAYKANWDEDPGPAKVVSLKTSDRDVARLRARADIERHVQCKLIAAADADKNHKWGDLEVKYEIPPGTDMWLDDDTNLSADDKFITLRRKGAEPVIRANRIRFGIGNWTQVAKRSPEYEEMMKVKEQNRSYFQPPAVDLDTEIVETYIRNHKPGVKDGSLGSLQRTLADWKSIAPELNFATADRPDAQRLVDHMMEEHDISGTRAKRIIAMLRCAVADEMSNKMSRVVFNVFDVGRLSFPKEDGEGEIERPSYTQADIEKIKENRETFTDEQWLMIVWHMSTSMRPKAIRSVVIDAWEEAQDEAGNAYTTRYYKVRHDKSKKYGKRDIAFPQALLDAKKLDKSPLLPEKIEGPLFTTEQGKLLRQINFKFEQLGIHQEGDNKTFYSGRHRAKDMMMRRGVHEDMRRAIMGHTRRMDSHDLYGHGFAQWEVKLAIDKIGF